jgi:hypothetical protein
MNRGARENNGTSGTGIRLQEPAEWQKKFGQQSQSASHNFDSDGNLSRKDGFSPGHRGHNEEQNHKSSGRVVMRGLIWDKDGQLLDDADDYGAYTESGLLEDAQFRKLAMRTTDESCQRQHCSVNVGEVEGGTAGLESPKPSVPPLLGPMLPKGDKIIKQLQGVAIIGFPGHHHHVNQQPLQLQGACTMVLTESAARGPDASRHRIYVYQHGECKELSVREERSRFFCCLENKVSCLQHCHSSRCQ